METNKTKAKVTHKPHSIRFTDKAIDELKYRNNYNHRQNVRFIDGPPGVTLRWTPKTNKKIFQIMKRLLLKLNYLFFLACFLSL